MFLLGGQGRNDRFDSTRFEWKRKMSNLRRTKTEQRMQRMTNRREGHLHHGRGGNITLKLAAASFISLYAPPSAAEIQINDKSASAFQPSSPYFIPLSQYSIPPLLPNIGNQPEGLPRLLLRLFLFCSNARISINEFLHILGKETITRRFGEIATAFFSFFAETILWIYSLFSFLFNFKFIDLIYHNFSIICSIVRVASGGKIPFLEGRLFQPNRRFVSATAHFSVVSFSRFKEFRESLAGRR